MFTLFHAIFGIIHLALGIIGTRHWLAYRSSYGLIALAIAYTLSFDNFAIALGALLGEGELLRAINVPRFVIHALFTPMLIIFACGAARRAGVRWTQSKGAHALFCIVATVLIAYGAYVDIFNLRLEPARFHDVLRYANEFFVLRGPPLPAMLTVLILIAVGAALWFRARWSWLFVGAVIMLVAAGAAGSRAITLSNLGELFLSGAVVATMIAMDGRIPRAARARAVHAPAVAQGS